MVLDIIGDVSPDETPLATMLKTKTASNTLHQCLLDYVSRSTSVTGAIEGAAAT